MHHAVSMQWSRASATCTSQFVWQTVQLVCERTHRHALNVHGPVPAQIMDEIQAGLRYMFQTESKYTCLVTGSGAHYVSLYTSFLRA